MPHPVFRPGARAFITGGASGVGLAIAKLCASHGMKLALADINTSNLAAAKSVLTSGSSKAQQVETLELDVSRLDAWEGARAQVEAAFGDPGVDLLVLNAGTSVAHSLSSVTGSDGSNASGAKQFTDAFRTIFDTNLFGYVHGLATFMGSVAAAQKEHGGAGHTAVVLTGSKQGITNPPGNPAYNASKAAVKSLAEQLAFDTRGSGTSVHLLVPGWTFTGLTGGGGLKQKPDGAWAPEQVAEYLFLKMGAGSFYVVCPDNDVTEDLDKRRMLWAAGDAVYDRPALSRWREDWKDKAQEGIDNTKV